MSIDFEEFKKLYAKKFKFVVNVNSVDSINDINDSNDVNNIIENINVTNSKRFISGITTADPFIIKDNGTNYLFYEKIKFGRKRGDIFVCKILSDENNNILTVEEKLNLHERFHLSYPNVFFDNGKFYMIPESRQCGEIRLYEFINFPHKPKFLKTLLKFDGLDTNIIYYDEYYYLFTWSECCLHIFYSKNLLGEFTKHPHVLNFSGRRITGNGRNGGKFFFIGNNLYFPRQHNINHYGENLQIIKVTKLTTEDYNEELVTEIKGIHHMTFTNDYIVTDSCVL